MELQLFDLAAILLVLASAFGLANHHFVKLPFAIGILVAAMVASLFVMGMDLIAPAAGMGDMIAGTVKEIDFTDAVLEGMLGFLLFAGALHTDYSKLKEEIGPILVLASVGLVISTLLVGGGAWLLFEGFGLGVPFLFALVFGALISPSDPVAVLGIMRAAGAPKEIELKIVGESLFNDGFAVVLFSALVVVASGGGGGHESIGAFEVVKLIGEEVLGGVGLGLACGYLTYLAMKTLNEPDLEIMMSFALVMAITFVGVRLHVSAPLACVVAGLFIGNRGRDLAMSDRTSRDLDIVWSFIDESLNAVLFLLIGLEILEIPFDWRSLQAGLLLIPVVVLARFVAVAVPLTAYQLRRTFRRGARRILTWGGLKGGISIALAMSLPEFEGRDAVLTATYAVVVFSILVQGLTVGTLIERIITGGEASAE